MPSPISTLHTYFEENDLWHKTIELKRGDHLHLAGDRDDNVYYVDSGLLRAYVLVNDDEQIIRFAYQGDFLVAMDSFFTGGPTMLYASALRKTTVRVIRKSKYNAAIVNDPELNKIWQQILSWMVVGQLEREIDLLTNDPAERFRRVAERSPRLFQEVPAKYIANYLRMTAETLSRLKAR
ncbi:Crp/Fnr family transcriptional regulator [Neolewinella aurantiaca]|uniref:Crp/Fnr family transcriptional regulator n=1 Tax=Neolewinella aurantiaca TaxID=2602767 RepID=A0A5C7FGE8_9BACT|nr:Crp/Fnr family transcriptional regulator [Neolewinella aurantiaca]TXF89409.1 Crp/Fnr family transcriptional regulator [Neolewinella aurantiaca]